MGRALDAHDRLLRQLLKTFFGYEVCWAAAVGHCQAALEMLELGRRHEAIGM